MKPCPIANLEQRLTKYRAELKRWLFIEVPLLIVICSAMTTAFVFFIESPDESILTWISLSAVFGVFLALPPLSIIKPVKPTQSDVNRDVALRDAFNIDSTISK